MNTKNENLATDVHFNPVVENHLQIPYVKPLYQNGGGEVRGVTRRMWW